MGLIILRKTQTWTFYYLTKRADLGYAGITNPGTYGVTVGSYIVGQVMSPPGMVTIVQPEFNLCFYLVPPNNTHHVT